MKKQIQEYMNAIKLILKEDKPGTDWKDVAVRHLVKIEFYQHERLIHLIVTALFAVMEIICVATLLMTENLWALTLMIMILVLLVPYIGHYYFLENSVQELYLIYDAILSRRDRNKDSDKNPDKNPDKDPNENLNEEGR